MQSVPGMAAAATAASSNDTWAVQAVQIVKRFAQTTALDRLDLNVKPGEFYSLLGPSGCGKTTLLRILAGLDHPDTGTLRLNGQDALPVPAHRRPVNTVFQSYALFPHLTVAENVAFGLRMKGVARSEIEDRVGRAMNLVEIGRLRQRKPAQLSGGEKQRVALARALINEPALLLLDEPLGALDLQLRQQLQTDLHRLQRRLGITFVYVTHDQDEALTLSDRIAVLNQGRIEQEGTGRELYQSPRNRFVARFLGQCNLLDGTAVAGNGEASVSTPCGVLRITTAPANSRVTLAIRPERFVLNPSHTSLNVFSGTVTEIIYNGAETRLAVAVRDLTLRVTLFNSNNVRPAQAVRLHAPPEAITVLED